MGRHLTIFFLLIFSTGFLVGADFGPNYVNIRKLSGVAVDLRYATTNNFTGVKLYKDLKDPYLQKDAAKKLEAAIKKLSLKKPGWKLLVFDALRPRSVQFQLWEKVRGTSQEKYVANPLIGSLHNFGFAVDLSLQDEYGKEVDMGTPFDSFEDLAQPDLENKYLKLGKLKTSQLNSRKLLREVMTGAGFTQLKHEWWHYDALPLEEVKKQYPIVE
ncbi:MAG: hypothetical protein A4S09_06830 [Proteobacteria bacterium SG_bin7]|nr:MAG: hypothetical protein A4S09_06830 [Proteobacteria bacterium SG_bin7]